jgi:phage terminase small subunit
MALKGKMQVYAEARAAGLRPVDAGIQAGYAAAGVRVTTSRLEARVDIQDAIKRFKNKGRKVKSTAAGMETEGEFEKWLMKDHYESPLALLQDVMNNPKAPKSLRYQAAKDALPYCHARKEGSKKDEAKDKASKAAKGHFGTAPRPSHMGVY